MFETCIREGYAPQQTALDIENLTVAGMADSEWELRETFQGFNLRQDNLRHFLGWIKNTYDPRRVYYPFCGWHITPREVFGDRVVHLSLDDCHPHLKDLVSGLRVQADILHQPFSGKIFDAVILNSGHLKNMDFDAVFTCLREVVKDDGFLIVADTEGPLNNYCRKYLQKANVPENIGRAITGCCFGLYLNQDKPVKKRFLFWKR